MGLWPGRFALSGSQVGYVHPTDWSASPDYPGTGFTLMRHVLRSTGISLVVGGSADSQAIFPKLGFRVSGGMEVYARAIRPWRRNTSGRRSWGVRDAARVLRDTRFSFERVPPRPAGWSASIVDEELTQLDPCFAQVSASGAHSLRSRETMRYLLGCPHVNGRLASVSREGQVCGYFMLNSIEGECRIVDIHVQSDQPEHWRSAYALALQTAIDDENTSEVVAATSLPWIGTILSECGLRLRRQKPVFLADRADQGIYGVPLSLQLADSDKFCYPEF